MPVFEDDIVAFDIGEIDLRCGLFSLSKKKNTELNTLTDDLLKSYFDFLLYFKNNVKKIAGEWHLHLRDVNLTEKFREFRDIYLKLFPNHEIFSIDGMNIKWDLWNEHFIEYYRHILIYIDNR